MILSQTSSNLSSLLSSLSRRKPMPLKIFSTVKLIVINKLQLEILIDKWPEPSALVIRPKSGYSTPTRYYAQAEKTKYPSYGHIFTEFENDYIVYADDTECLKPLLSQFDWSSPIYFADLKLNNSAYKCVKDYIHTKYGDKCWEESEPIMTYIKDDSEVISRTPPEEFKLRRLKMSDAEFVNSVWTYGGSERCLDFISSLIQHLPTYGIDHVPSGQLVACILTGADLSLAMGHVISAYRRYGLMQYLIHKLSTDVQQQYNQTIYGHVSIHNTASQTLMDKVSWRFQPGSMSVWAIYRPHQRIVSNL